MQETWVRSLGWKDPLEKTWLPTLVFLPGEFHGQRSLVGYSSRGHKESDTTEQLILTVTGKISPPWTKGVSTWMLFSALSSRTDLGSFTNKHKTKKGLARVFQLGTPSGWHGFPDQNFSQKSLLCTSFPLAETVFGIRSGLFMRSLDFFPSFLVSSFFKKNGSGVDL